MPHDTPTPSPESGGIVPPRSEGPAPPAATERADAAPIVRALAKLRAAARRRLLFQGAGFLLACALGVIVALGFADYYLRMPWGVRLVLWTFGLLAIAYGIIRRVAPAWSFRPSLTEVALRLERTPEGRKAGLRGVVASGLELASQETESSTTGQLSRASVAQAVDQLSRVRPRALLLRPTHTRRVAALVLAALALAAGVWAWKQELSAIGARRVLTPWTDASWPKRTAVLDANALAAHPTTSTLPLRALITKTPHDPGNTDVAAIYRIILDGVAGPTQRVLLTSQGRRALSRGETDLTISGEMYERLLEPGALLGAPREGAAKPKRVELEYAFETDDDETPTHRVRLVEPPAIRSATLTITPPAYAADALGPDSPFAVGAREMGGGQDQRATVGPVLRGSSIRLTLAFNKALPIREGSPSEFLAAAFPGSTLPTEAITRAAPDSWTIEWTLDQSVRLAAALVDEFGLKSLDEPVYRVESVEDRAPGVVVVEPAQDESVLPTAIVPAAVEGRDDVGLRSLAMQTQPAIKNPTSVGAPPEPTGEPKSLAVRDAWLTGEDRTKTRLESPIDLAPMQLKAGDELHLTALGADAFPGHEATRSAIRRLRIISTGEFVEQVRAELAGVREAAMRLEREQSRLAESRSQAAENAEAAAGQRDRQRSITDRLGPLDDVVKRLSRRLERNQFDDREMKGMLEDAGALLDSASQSSREAQQGLDQLARPEQRAEDRAQNAEKTGEQQKEVADALTQLANMLDRGQDTYAVRRQIERLITDQRQTQAQTRSTGDSTRGQDPSALSPAQREELERLAQRQQELAQRGSQAIDQLQQRAKQMESVDAGQAQAMKSAAQQARDSQLENAQRDAAEQIRQNQTSRAEQEQEQAINSLQKMLEQLDNVQQQRDQALRRQIAELIDQLRRLVARQEAELALLGKGVEGAGLEGLDPGMITLNNDTIAAEDRARKELRNAGNVADLLGAATDAQSTAIAALRQRPVDAPQADEGERRSLTRLRDALAAAEKLEQDAEDRENDRKRAELLKLYQEALEKQLAIQGETDPFVGKEAGRRERITLRGLGGQQQTLHQSVADIRAKFKDVGESGLFDYAHRRLDLVQNAAAKALLEGAAPTQVGRDQSSAVAILRSLVEALKDAQNKKKDEFRDQENGGGGGGGQGGQQQQPILPPYTELKLLRMMQGEAADRTRTASDQGDREPIEGVAELQKELSRLGQDLLDKLKRQGGPPPAPRPKIEPAEPAEPAPPAPDEGADAPKPQGDEGQDPKPEDPR